MFKKIDEFVISVFFLNEYKLIYNIVFEKGVFLFLCLL